LNQRLLQGGQFDPAPVEVDLERFEVLHRSSGSGARAVAGIVARSIVSRAVFNPTLARGRVSLGLPRPRARGPGEGFKLVTPDDIDHFNRVGRLLEDHPQLGSGPHDIQSSGVANLVAFGRIRAPPDGCWSLLTAARTIARSRRGRASSTIEARLWKVMLLV
jgi:hypothetical protein